MAVLLPNATLRVRKRAHTFDRDAHGTPLPTPVGPVGAALPGSLLEQPNGGWNLRLAPSTWRVEPGDEVLDEHDRVFVVTDARLCAVPGHPDVDHVAARATLNPPRVP